MHLCSKKCISNYIKNRMYNLKSYVRFCELNGLKEKFPTMTDEDAKKFCSSCTESMLTLILHLDL